MKLIKVENYELKIADEALLVRPFRRLWNMDRTASKEHFYRQMSIIFFTYSPSSNYSYIPKEEDRLKEVLVQEGISNFRETTEFKAAVEAYKKLTKTTSSELLSDVQLSINKIREAINSIDFTNIPMKDKVNAINTATAIVSKIPKLVKDLVEAEKAVNQEIEEQDNARGNQELTVLDFDY